MKVFIKPKANNLLNEQIAITDPGLAKQYLTVQKQILDKKTQKDQAMKTVNQIDNEINILEKNLLAIEANAAAAGAIQQKQQQEITAQQQAAAKEAQKAAQVVQKQTPAVAESVSHLLKGKKKINIEEYREAVYKELIRMLTDEPHNIDPEGLLYTYAEDIVDDYDNGVHPDTCADGLIAMEMWANKDDINESVYEDIVDNIEREMAKLKDIRNYIETYDDAGEEETEVSSVDLVLKATEVPDFGFSPNDDLEAPYEEDDFPYEDGIDDEEFNYPEDEEEFIEEPTQPEEEDEFGDELVGPEEEDPFEPSDEERLVDSTLKAESDKEPWSPGLLEDEEEGEYELEKLEYEEEFPPDDYNFHVKIDPDTEEEIIAKIYRESDEENWVVRVVKGDEEPLQSMEFDSRLDKLEIIGYLADLYEEIEIIDPREYEYLLDDKEEVDREYYEDVMDDDIEEEEEEED